MQTENYKTTVNRCSVRFIPRLLRAFFTLIVAGYISGCASNVTVKGDIPKPLVERLPLKVHLNYTDEFRNHIYQENEKKRALKSLNMAQAQMDMFNQVFGNMTTLVSPEANDRDLTIQPEILEFQYSAPSETKLKQYEIWIKYRLKILDSDNADIADWVIKGYGKTPTAMLTSASKAFNSATNVALRDAGAQLAINFKAQRKIKALIDQKNGAATLASNTNSDDSLATSESIDASERAESDEDE